jgi:hypothetical protein
LLIGLRVLQPPYASGTWIFNYNLFYSFNGCSNQLLSVAFNATYSAAEYYMCPTGIHEGVVPLRWMSRASNLRCRAEYVLIGSLPGTWPRELTGYFEHICDV